MIASTHHQFYGWIRCVSTPEMEAFFTMTFLPVVRIVRGADYLSGGSHGARFPRYEVRLL